MNRQSEAALGARNTLGGQLNADAGRGFVHSQDSTGENERQAPSGDLPAYMANDGLIYVAGRHLCAVRNGTLARTLNSTRELKLGGPSFRLDVLAVAKEAGATRIIVTDRETRQRWAISMADFERNAWPYTHTVFGAQLVCDLRWWATSAPEPQTEPGEPRQLSLFGEVRR